MAHSPNPHHDTTAEKIEALQSSYEDGIAHIEAGQWEEATYALAGPSLQDYKGANVLYAYATARGALSQNSWESAEAPLGDIPDDYTGDLSDIINKDKPDLVATVEKLKKQYLWDSAQLELLSFRWGRETDSFVSATGEVKNVGKEPLDAVEAVVTFRTSDGTLIKTESALVKYDPVMPGQTTPFEVITTYNPMMKTANIQFATILGISSPPATDERSNGEMLGTRYNNTPPRY